MLTLQKTTLARNGVTLINDADLSIFPNDRVGLIGRNGCGKSTLFAAILNQLEPLSGNIQMKKDLRIAALSQEVPGLEISALDFVISADAELLKILDKLKQAEMHQNDEEIMACHHELFEKDGYGAEAKASKILSGLGFSHEQMSLPVKTYSGGWRMRLGLARCLFAPSELMLLDEPTNHLDLEAIVWLSKFLKNYAGAVLMISHDKDFLDETVTQIAHVENQSLKIYSGNYTQFETQRSLDIALQNVQYKKQQDKISHMMKFVNRFAAKASKAKQAQSRLNAVQKMEKIMPILERLPFRFHFLTPDKSPSPLVSLRKVDLGYQDKTILKHIQLNILPGDRIGLLGINGAGKSTLIKGICNEIQPISGHIEKASGIKISYFAQHLVDHLSLDLSPLELLIEKQKNLNRYMSEKEMLSYLGGFGFHRDQSLMPIKNFSGGEKSKVALALIIQEKPHLLLLDEPANHLDIEMREALTLALQEYEGSILLVSHDRYLMRTLVDELYLIRKGGVEKYDGTVQDYQNALE